MRKLLYRLLAGTLIGLAPAAATAVSIDFGLSNLNGNTLTDLSGPGMLSFRLEHDNAKLVTLVVDLTSLEDVITWNAQIDNLVPGGLESLFDVYVFDFTGAVIALAGSVRDGLDQEPGVATSPALAPTHAEIDFAPPGEAAGFTVGNPDGAPDGDLDWLLDASTAGGTFSFTLTPIAVPEPNTLALMIAGLAALTRAGRLR